MLVGMWVRRIADFGLVDVLAAGAAGAHGVDAHVRFLDVDIDAVVDHRIDRDARERGVAAGIGIERRNAHQPVHAVFGLEPAIGVVALDLDGRRLDAGFFAVGLFDVVDLEAVLLGPAHIHAQQHVGPVLALGAAGAGMHFEVGIVGVGLARQQRLELAARDLGLERAQRRLRLGDDLLVVLGLAELDHRDLVVEVLLDAGDRGELVLERGALLHHPARALRVVPEIGVFGLPVQLGKPRRAPCRRQRCLLSSPTDCLISSTMASISARMGYRFQRSEFECQQCR